MLPELDRIIISIQSDGIVLDLVGVWVELIIVKLDGNY